MHSDVAISVKNLTKTYRIFGHPGDRIKQALTFGQKRYHKEFTALNDVSFEIKKGETVGIIGRNGSGKSTLLQLICGILKPTSGSVDVNGRISALLELGAGFNPEFTGRENVYFQGAVMGFTKAEMDARFDDIAAFADIGEFIEQPVRTYSSGMYMRLAFSVAISSEPEILIVDEAFSVGDVVFQHKSKKRILQLRDAGTSLLLVSHDRNAVAAMCHRCILLDKGHLAMDAMALDVMDYYYATIAANGGVAVRQTHSDFGKAQTLSGSGEAVVESIRLLDNANYEIEVLVPGQEVTLEFHVKSKEEIPRLILGFAIRDQFGQEIYGINTKSYDQELKNVSKGSNYIFRFSFFANIGIGTYSISTALTSTNDHLENNYQSCDLAYFFSVHNTGQRFFGGVAWLNPILEIHRF
ncbi:ABC transporter ATP-binding protein [Rhodoferax sp.]|uniref:ABC transporter ATP-binding protein n=1 Tax=Rhodoferax sp. TaxID=50421 RepID=UPI0028450A3D|nr:ABC transporter ATP-binding protein [Rhodoferax sp.]MDR3371645.1 ABC transporter ATP-binding protein [Rhodoferax sp.]